MRQVVLDTETTGLDIANDHRIIEIAGVELVNRKLTKNSYQIYLNPERAVGQSFKIHGLTDDFLSDKPLFKDCLLYTSPSPRDAHESRMPSSA